MARSIASATISFGMVSIPVDIYPATQSSSGISFNLLHKDCGSRLKQQYTCIKEGVVVERADMVKGYEFAEGRYVTFTKDELKALEEPSTQMVEITEFVAADAIDPIYYDKAYYLAPGKGGAKPYALLRQAMHDAQRFGLGNGPRKPVQHKSFPSFTFRYSLFNYSYHHLVRDQLAFIHEGFGQLSEVGAFFDRCPEYIPRRNMLNAILAGYTLSLSSFSRAGRSKKYQPHKELSTRNLVDARSMIP